MIKGGPFLISVAVLSIAACTGEEGKLEIRAMQTALAPGVRAVPFRIAEARGQLAIGNVALALEGFRKASREDPNSVDALTGMASCYDQMGRFDLSRRNYEAALAIAPKDQQLLALLAASLDLQGRRDEAGRVRQEMAAARAPAATGAVTEVRQASVAVAETVAPVKASQPADFARVKDKARIVAEAPAAKRPAIVAGDSVSVMLPPAPVQTASQDRAAPKPEVGSPRLERVSLGEVALLSSQQVPWQAQIVAASARSTTIRFVPLVPTPARFQVQLLNAARIDRLAARTRVWLAQRGWRGLAIGDAPAVRSRSLILYPAHKRALAQRLASQFGFAMAQRSSSAQVTVLLGRDAARSRLRRTTRA